MRCRVMDPERSKLTSDDLTINLTSNDPEFERYPLPQSSHTTIVFIPLNQGQKYRF